MTGNKHLLILAATHKAAKHYAKRLALLPTEWSNVATAEQVAGLRDSQKTLVILSSASGNPNYQAILDAAKIESIETIFVNNG